MPAVTCPVDHAVADLAEVAHLVACQCAAGLSRDDVLDALFRSWSSRLRLLGTCSDAHKSSLTAAITAGPWTNEQRKSLAGVLIHHPDSSPVAKRRPNQKCCHFGNFIPAALWVKLRDTTNVSQVSRASMLATLGHALGLECPDQPTLYRMASVLVYCDRASELDQDAAFNLMSQLQTFLKAPPRKAGLPYLEFYPCSASLLPDSIQGSAYPDGELPVDVDIPALAMALGGAKMRGRSKTGGVPEWLHHVPHEFRADILVAVGLGGAAGPSSGVKVEPSEQPPVHQPLPSADALRFKIIQPVESPDALAASKREPPSPEFDPLCDGDAHGDDGAAYVAELLGMVPPEVPSKVADAGSIEDMEASLLSAAAMGKEDRVVGKKRPAAAADLKIGPPDVGCMKRPAAAPKKRPASTSPGLGSPMVGAPHVDMSDIWRRLKANSDVSRNCFCSRAYHPSRSKMLAAGGTQAQAKAFGQSMAQRASALYDTLHGK